MLSMAMFCAGLFCRDVLMKLHNRSYDCKVLFLYRMFRVKFWRRQFPLLNILIVSDKKYLFYVIMETIL